MKPKTDQVIAGKAYNSLVLTGNYSFVQTKEGRRMVVEARCKCGIVKNYPFRFLKTGNTKSCGCVRAESNSTHSLSKHPLYSVYQDMRRRCYDSGCASFKYYGARGIICKWEDVKSFCDWGMANGYKKGLEIDRINNDGNYEPSNCRFITRSVGNTNTRRTKRVTAFGETKVVAEWVRDARCSISERSLMDRLRNGKWDIEKAITYPPNAKKRNCAVYLNLPKEFQYGAKQKV